MKRIAKLALIVLVVAIAAIGVLAACGQDYTWGPVGSADPEAQVSGNGSVAVAQGNTVYFVNGEGDLTTITEAEINWFGQAGYKGSIMKGTLAADGSVKDAAVVVPKMFYNGQLVAMTSRENRPQAFEWLVTSENRVDTDLGGQTSSRSNPRQIKETCDVFNRLTEQGIKRDSIGIVTPYKAQAGKLRSLLPDIEIDTVHKFQGREKDVVIFNSVSNKPTRFNDQPNLLNVAVSRAKDRFFLLSPAFDDYPNSNLAALVRYIRHLDPKLRKITVSPCRSVFDALYRKKPLCVVKHSGESPAEAIFRKLLEETLKKESFKTWDYSQEYPLRLIPRDFAAFTDREVQYMLNNARLDFLIFDSIDKQPIATIEVDGCNFHQKGSRQAERDEVKNSILAKVRLPLLRLRTDSVEGQEKKQLEQFEKDT